VSSVTWLDFSETHQQKINEALKNFEEKGTVDDLGFGSIRDAISGTFFPGTSVLQTRAKYFLLIPWIYQYAAERWGNQLQAKAADLERKLIAALMESDDTDGVIGSSRGKDLKNLPSSIYWSGLQTFGIFLLKGRGIRHYARMANNSNSGTEFEGEFDQGSQSLWDSLPPAPLDFFSFKYAELALSKEEAVWLSERFMSSQSILGHPNLLSELVRRIQNNDQSFLESDYVWDVSFSDQVDEDLISLVEHSKHFSNLAHGASLLYNLLLIEALTEKGREISFEYDYLDRLSEWVIESEASGLVNWCGEINLFWGCLEALDNKIPEKTRIFVTQLARIIAKDGLEGFATNQDLQDLVRQREKSHKKHQARLFNDSRLSAYQGEAGLRPMNFRWNLVCRLFSDIAVAYELESD
jgi:hypothetical protein